MYFSVIIWTMALVSAYEDIDDSYNYKDMLTNTTELHHFVACFIDKEPCTITAGHIKGHLFQMVEDSCAECDIIQKHYAHAFFDSMRKKFPDEYQEYRKKYDPDGKHFSILEKAITKY